MLERQEGHERRIIDNFGNFYRTLEWREVRDLTWKEKRLFLEPHPTHTARPGETAFSGDTRAPTFVRPQQLVAPRLDHRERTYTYATMARG